MSISHEALLSRLRQLRTQEKELMVSILNDLLEIDTHGLYLAHGYTSMFKFMQAELGYSEAEALIRLNAMRLLRSVPELAAKIETGAVSLTNAAVVGRQIRREEERRKAPMAPEEKLAILEVVENVSTRECERLLARAMPEIQPMAEERTQVLRGEKTMIQFVASAELMKKFERLKELLAHKNYSGRYDLLFEELADIALKKLDPLSRKEQKRDALVPGASAVSLENDAAMPGTPSVAARPRAIRVSLRRALMRRAKGQCEYSDPGTGRRCASRHGLEIDHIVRFRDGGTNDIENLRVLCRNHNQGREKFPQILSEPTVAYCA